MKIKFKCAQLLLALCLIAASFPCGVPAAQAASSDFDVSYEITPNPMGPLGADAKLLLTVENKGDTDITWVRVDINMATPYSRKWNAPTPIRPGTKRKVSFDVPFTAADVNVGRTLYVSMNNDGDVMQDGDKTFTFNIRSQDVLTVSSTISPAAETYFPGDTVTITVRFKNNMTANAATGVVTDVRLTKDGNILNDQPDVSQGTIMPEQSKTMTFNYTLRAQDAGTVNIHYRVRANMMGRDYDLISVARSFQVAGLVLPTFHILEPSPEPEPPEVEFTAELSADPLEIDAGDMVAFRVKVRNIGEDDISGFKILNTDGIFEAEVGHIDAGDDESVVINKEITESCDVSFTVVGGTGGVTSSEETNVVHITVREAAETASATATAAVEEQAAPAQSAAASEAAETASSQPGTPDILYLLIIILALIIIAGIIVIVLLTGRKRE